MRGRRRNSAAARPKWSKDPIRIRRASEGETPRARSARASARTSRSP